MCDVFNGVLCGCIIVLPVEGQMPVVSPKGKTVMSLKHLSVVLIKGSITITSSDTTTVVK